MKKKLICSILALSLALIPMGYLAPAQTVQAAEEKRGLERYQGYNVIEYGGYFYHPIAEDTLMFEDITKPESYTVLSKGTVVRTIGLLYLDIKNTGFIYVDYDGVKGYVDSQFIDMNNFVEPDVSMEKITVYNEAEGKKLILEPIWWWGEGKYIDQDGYPRNINGDRINPVTGELYVEPEFERYGLLEGGVHLIFKDGTEYIMSIYDVDFDLGPDGTVYVDQNGVFRNCDGKKIDPNTREILE